MVSCNNPVFIVYAVYNLQRLAELLQVGAELLADFGVLQCQLHLRLHDLELVALIVVLAGELDGGHATAGTGLLCHGIGQLDLATGTGLGVGKDLVNLRGQQHAAQNGIVAEFLPLFGFLDHVIHKEVVVVDGSGL